MLALIKNRLIIPSTSSCLAKSVAASANPFLQSIQSNYQYQITAGFKWVPPQTNKKGPNVHRSNRAKQGLFHGKDVRFGHRITYSHSKSKRQWRPNVHKKNFWSYALDDYVQFKATTAAIKAIDMIGGIDNYLLNLDEKLVSDSNYVTKYRNLIAATLFHKGELPPKYTKYLGYDRNPPPEPFVGKKAQAEQVVAQNEANKA